MLQSSGYFNSSLWDTVPGEYYRSFNKKTDYYHIFDYRGWGERAIDDTLLNECDWERAERGTFRSNQIREGDLTGEQALEFVEDENRPRDPNIKWYLDAIGLEFCDVILAISAIPKLYQ